MFWDTTDHQARAARQIAHRQRQAEQKKKDLTNWIRFRRITGELTAVTGESLGSGSFLLHDFTPEGICLFTTERFLPEQELHLRIGSTLEAPIKLKVVRCREIPTESKIISTRSFRYQTMVSLPTANPGEEEIIRLICQKFQLAIAPRTS